MNRDRTGQRAAALSPPTGDSGPRGWKRLEFATGPLYWKGTRRRGVTFVAVHGCPGTVDDFKQLATVLEPQAGLIRIASPGFGETPWETDPSTRTQGRGAFIRNAIEALGLEQVVLLGHSMGAPVAAEACSLLGDQALGLGLLASVGVRPHAAVRWPRLQLVAPLLDRPSIRSLLMPLVRHGFRSAGFSKAIMDQSLHRALQIAAKLSYQHFRDRLAMLKTPTLVAWCEDDPLISSRLSMELERAAPPGPRLKWMKGGHLPQVHHPEELGKALLRFRF